MSGQGLSLSGDEEHVWVVGGLLTQGCLQVLAKLWQHLWHPLHLGVPLDLGALDFGHHMLHRCKSPEHWRIRKKRQFVFGLKSESKNTV